MRIPACWSRSPRARPPPPRPSPCRTRSGPRNCCCTTAPRSRRTTTCRASRAARKSRASRSPARAPDPMPPRFRTPASSAAGRGRGESVIGIRLNFSKRYITLAPIATVIGLAFRLYDPEQLMGEKTDLGITCALIPRDTPGVSIGRRHFPLNVPFQNGPDPGAGRVRAARCHHRRLRTWPARAGACWWSSCRSGRCISLPSNATGGAQAAVYASGAYARIRRQFNTPIGSFEGIEQVLARMAARTYIMDAARSVTAGAIDGGEKPSVPSAMLKYHVTELGRQVANDAMDVHGGKGICLGPEELSRPRLPGRAGRHHGRGRQHPDAQPDHLRPGRGPLPSLRAARR